MSGLPSIVKYRDISCQAFAQSTGTSHQINFTSRYKPKLLAMLMQLTATQNSTASNGNLYGQYVCNSGATTATYVLQINGVNVKPSIALTADYSTATQKYMAIYDEYVKQCADPTRPAFSYEEFSDLYAPVIFNLADFNLDNVYNGVYNYSLTITSGVATGAFTAYIIAEIEKQIEIIPNGTSLTFVTK